MIHIFYEIVSIMENDYAGCRDKQSATTSTEYSEEIIKLNSSSRISREQFVEFVQSYLRNYEDHHISFKDMNIHPVKNVHKGFKVRRYEEVLYITEISSENTLKVGMKIHSLGGKTIKELKQKHIHLLNENHPERENWTPILTKYDYGVIEDQQGKVYEIEFQNYKRSNYEARYTLETYDNKTLILTITDFMDSDAIARLINENQELLVEKENWIIDVRVNYGGADVSFYHLLPYIMPEDGIDLLDTDEFMLFNCTSANADKALKEIQNDLENTKDPETIAFLRVFQREWEKNKGKGFVQFDFADIIPDTFVKGTKLPKKVIVLSDTMCGSSGDSFVEICKKSNKVTVLGRPTKGLNDYANLVTQEWEEGFQFSYPTSRLSRIDKGRGMSKVGIKPDIYIPWTPKHLEVDVDLEFALSFINRFYVS
ncbi:S41 family peptidase [Mangrovibacillus cuniculi]|uniref:Tail specific protease domain-containing protein n=1 Tax=Mangrovibacillus cuniculi TaxID=2593652 RepID=A0A7S8HFW6_9BACI|nr:S41 family peptidase [Mangrovibacillus cuniculi]QPC46971.1 hypothetical protein G8O30_08350 [Mangrovibacillus cuniculi]